MKMMMVIAAWLLLSGCETVYYSAWEKLGVEKRDILVDRIEDTQQAQEDAQQEFKDALEQYRSVVNFDGGDLEKAYNRLNAEYEDSKAAAQAITDRVNSVENVAEDLFSEWEDELAQYSSDSLRRSSARQLRDTRAQYQQLIRTMRRAEKSVQPVLRTLNDQVLYLKHNLNARAVIALKGEYGAIKTDVNRLIGEMQRSINQANAFIEQMKN